MISSTVAVGSTRRRFLARLVPGRLTQPHPGPGARPPGLDGANGGEEIGHGPRAISILPFFGEPFRELEAPTKLVATVAHISARSGSAPSDAALVAAARAGEPWAREALFRRHARLANGLAFRLLGRDDQDIDDIVQDAYVTVLDKLDRLEDPQAFASFLSSIVVHRVSRLLRRRRLARRLGLLPRAVPIDPTSFMAATAPPDAVAELRSIYAIVEDLPTDERLALLLRRVEGLPLEEVARLCDCSLATVKRRIAAAEARLEAVATSAPPSSAPARAGRTGT